MGIWTMREKTLLIRKEKRKKKTWMRNNCIGWPKGLVLFQVIYIICLNTQKSFFQSLILIRRWKLKTNFMISKCIHECLRYVSMTLLVCIFRTLYKVEHQSCIIVFHLIQSIVGGSSRSYYWINLLMIKLLPYCSKNSGILRWAKRKKWRILIKVLHDYWISSPHMFNFIHNCLVYKYFYFC